MMFDFMMASDLIGSPANEFVPRNTNVTWNPNTSVMNIISTPSFNNTGAEPAASQTSRTRTTGAYLIGTQLHNFTLSLIIISSIAEMTAIHVAPIYQHHTPRSF